MATREYHTGVPVVSRTPTGGIGTSVTSSATYFRAGNQNSALVSVVIPCFNYGRFLAEAVESVVSQTGVRTEVIIVDDCSTDDSLSVARSLVAAKPNVALWTNRTNRGPVETFNNGLAKAGGEFLVRLDADDLLTPGALSRAVAVLQQHDNVGLVYGHPLHFSGTTLPTARHTPTRVLLHPGVEWLERRCLDGRNVITSPEVVMRKSVVDVVGGQQPLAHTHDMEMWLRIAAFSDVAYLQGCDQAWHRDHALSLSARLVDLSLDLKERRLAFDTLFSGIAAQQPWAQQLHAIALRTLDASSLSLAWHEIDRGAPDGELMDALLGQVRSVTRGTQLEVELIRALAGTNLSSLQVAHGFLRRAVDRIRQEQSNRRWRKYGEY